jgi:hypothetical protein
MNFASLQYLEKVKRFSRERKTRIGPDLADLGRSAGSSALSAQACVGEALGRPDERGPAVSGSGARRGMGLPGPFDQVVIDGPRSSPTSDGVVRGGNPSVAGWARRLT